MQRLLVSLEQAERVLQVQRLLASLEQQERVLTCLALHSHLQYLLRRTLLVPCQQQAAASLVQEQAASLAHNRCLPLAGSADPLQQAACSVLQRLPQHQQQLAVSFLPSQQQAAACSERRRLPQHQTHLAVSWPLRQGETVQPLLSTDLELVQVMR